MNPQSHDLRLDRADPSREAKPQRVLVVEDSEFVHQIYRVAFRRLGRCEVIHANHGLEGLAALDSSGPVDLIIVDVNMPVMDGLTFIHELRLRARDQNTPVLVSTTEDDKGPLKQAMGTGPSTFLRKPFDLSQLLAQLADVLHRDKKELS